MTRRTLFIANKWDKVQQKNSVMEEINAKLRKHWLTPNTKGSEAEIPIADCQETTGNDQIETQEATNRRTATSHTEAFSVDLRPRQSTVAPLAATIDRDHFRAGYLSKRTSDVVQHLKRIVPHNMKLQLRKHFRFSVQIVGDVIREIESCFNRWFQLVCSRVEYHVQRYLTTADLIDRCEHGQVYMEAKKNLQTVTDQARKTCREFDRYIDQVDTTQIADGLRMHLQLPAVRIKITTWNAEECPDGTGTIEDIQEAAKQKVQERVRHEIDNWDNQSHMIAMKRQEIACKARELIKQLEPDMTWITNALTREVEISIPGFRFAFLPRLNFIERIMIQLLSLGITGIGPSKRSFLAHREESMTEMAEATLDKLKSEKEVAAVARQAIGLEEIAIKFKEQLDQAIAYAVAEVEEIQAKCSASSFRATYRPMRESCLGVYDKLLHWELNHLFEGDQIENTEVSVEDHLLGRGKIGIYCKGVLRNGEMAVTVKRYSKEVNIRAIIQDYKWLKLAANCETKYGYIELCPFVLGIRIPTGLLMFLA